METPCLEGIIPAIEHFSQYPGLKFRPQRKFYFIFQGQCAIIGSKEPR
jgi:hypothetical protein